MFGERRGANCTVSETVTCRPTRTAETEDDLSQYYAQYPQHPTLRPLMPNRYISALSLSLSLTHTHTHTHTHTYTHARTHARASVLFLRYAAQKMLISRRKGRKWHTRPTNKHILKTHPNHEQQCKTFLLVWILIRIIRGFVWGFFFFLLLLFFLSLSVNTSWHTSKLIINSSARHFWWREL